jgi:purine-nucleoside phosphorylase
VTAALLEELAVLGVKTAIGFGAAGSLVSSDHVGKLLIARAAICRDGASREYTDARVAHPDPELLQLAVELAEMKGTSAVQGTIHTTDALYRETPAKIRQWRRWGADFVNLEAGPFYAVASHLCMRAVYLGLVTDYVAVDSDWEPGFWSRENSTDPLIVQVIRELVEHEGKSQ